MRGVTRRRCFGSLGLLLAAAGGCNEDGRSGVASREDALCQALPAPPPASLIHGAALDAAHADAWSTDVRAARDAIGDLVASFRLDGDFTNGTGGPALLPHAPGGFAASAFTGTANLAYVGSGAGVQNGAASSALTSVSLAKGATLSGWARVPAGGEGVLFGFGDLSPGSPKLLIAATNGALTVALGASANGGRLVFAPGVDRCWHHVAVVVPPTVALGSPVETYIDGVLAAPASGSGVVPHAAFFGGGFRLGEFSGPTANSMGVDDVRVFARALTATEVSLLAAPTGSGPRCTFDGSTEWTPGPRCVASTLATPAVDLAVRVLSDDTVAVVQDPTEWTRARFADECGVALGGLAVHQSEHPELSLSREYGYAATDTLVAHRPAFLAATQAPDHLLFGGCGVTAAKPTWQSVWPEALSELGVPLLHTAGDFGTSEARLAYVAFAKLPFKLQLGGTYAVRDPWGNAASFTYDATTISWAIEMNQVGYVADAPAKHAYVGAWLGPGSELSVTRFANAPFTVVADGTGATVLTGVAGPALADASWNGSPLRGAHAVRLDFSALQTPGAYRVRVPGLGSSRPFVIGPSALGEPFYVHARGLYHARCAPLDAAHTHWSRGDAHQTARVAAFPPEDDDYRDHSSSGWGFRDASGAYAAHSVFDVVASTATTTIAAGVHGGWHDAGDFDRNPWHLSAVEDLAFAYLLFPSTFTDGQLSLPESGNGVPDILDEAAWGIDVFRRTQGADGRVSTRIEATSHPAIWDPGLDTQPYYTSLATRTTSLRYAAAAATLSRALAVAGAMGAAGTWLDSAKRAYAFGTGPTRQTISFASGAATHSWTEAPSPDPGWRMRAAIALSLATGDARYAQDLAALGGTFQAELGAYAAQGSPLRMADLALAPALRVPTGWPASARAAILSAASTLEAGQATDPYGKVWYAPTHALFGALGWGNDGYMPIRHLVAAWRVSGDATHRRAALRGVDWMLGGNPQGRSLTTGLGAVPPMTLLDLPSLIDRIEEPVPGITPFGYVEGVVPLIAASRVYGMFEPAIPARSFHGAWVGQLPAPLWAAQQTQAQIVAKLTSSWPLWRRATWLEQANPATTEFTVYETIAPAAAVTGCLMPLGYHPSSDLITRPPRTGAAARDAWLALPLARLPRITTSRETLPPSPSPWGGRGELSGDPGGKEPSFSSLLPLGEKGRG